MHNRKPDKENSTYMWFIDMKIEKKSRVGYSKFIGMPESTSNKFALLKEKIEMLAIYKYLPHDELIAVTIHYNRSNSKRRIVTLYNGTFEPAPEEQDNYELKVYLQNLYDEFILKGIAPHTPKMKDAPTRHPLRLTECRFFSTEELDKFCTAMLSSFHRDEVINFRQKYLGMYADRLNDNPANKIKQTFQDQAQRKMVNSFKNH